MHFIELLGSDYVCRNASGVCDVQETCGGGAINCPADTKKQAGFVCRAASTICDLDEYLLYEAQLRGWRMGCILWRFPHQRHYISSKQCAMRTNPALGFTLRAKGANNELLSGALCLWDKSPLFRFFFDNTSGSVMVLLMIVPLMK